MMGDSAEQRLWKAIVITLIEDTDVEVMKIKDQLNILNAVFDSSVHLIYRYLDEARGHWFEHICRMADRDHGKVVAYIAAKVNELDLPNKKIIRDRKQYRLTDFGRMTVQ
jgi:hypothetical protein